MASAPQTSQLPLFYKQLVPLNKAEHGAWHARRTEKARWLAGQNAIPLTVEEFPLAQRHYPIIFSTGDNPVPLGLMGVNDGVNVFIEDDGSLREQIYIPAYVRRYPFLLAKLSPDAEELSLCVDPTSELVGEFDEGQPLFDGEEPSESCRNTLKFCEQFEIAGTKTTTFVNELLKHELLIDGEMTIQPEGAPNPFVYRGFKMVDEKKFRDLRGDVIRGWNQSGMLGLIYAHIFSLEMLREVFGRQAKQGKLRQAEAEATPEQEA